MFKHNMEPNTENLENGARLIQDYAFGHSDRVMENSAVFVSDDNIVYPSGRHLVMYDLNTKKSDFIRRENRNVSSITAMVTGFTKMKELLIVIAENMRTGPAQVSVYRPTRMKWDVFPHSYLEPDYEIPVIEVNKKYLISLARAPGKNPIISYWRNDK
jgi:hypothetical protein